MPVGNAYWAAESNIVAASADVAAEGIACAVAEVMCSMTVDKGTDKYLEGTCRVGSLVEDTDTTAAVEVTRGSVVVAVFVAVHRRHIAAVARRLPEVEEDSKVEGHRNTHSGQMALSLTMHKAVSLAAR